jgi:NEDD4-binding protein 2
MKRVIICVGIPGSGKSTRAAEILRVAQSNNLRGVICSTDDFFMVNGQYQFNGNKLSEYHARNFQKFALGLADGLDLVIVDNTNLVAAHREPYVKLARAMGYQVDYEVVGEFTEEAIATYAARNTHGVPLEGIRRMAKSVELPR